MSATVAIVDFGMGNLFSVQKALETVGLDAAITNDPKDVVAAKAVVLPGMGAFGDAMSALREHGLVEPIRDLVKNGKPFLGVCLGLQLMLDESLEFGRHEGLGMIAGTVVRFENPVEDGVALKVPQVGWNAIHRPAGTPAGFWNGSPLDGLPDGVRGYFVHSYYAKPADPSVILGASRYGQIEFPSALRKGNLFGCQFHPEKSGPRGIDMYRNFAKAIR
jgi:glutamine amidotransferase